MKKSYYLLLLSCFVVSYASAATPIFVWDGQYVTTTQNISLTTVVTGEGTNRVARVPYSWDTALSPTSDFTGPAFYGTVQSHSGANAEGDPQIVIAQVQYSVSGSRISFGASNTGPGNAPRGIIKGLIFFKKESFVDDAAHSIVRFDEDSALDLRVVSLTNAPRATKIAVHALLDGEWGWYLSSSQVTLTGTTLSIANLGDELWGAWEGVSSDSLLPDTPATYSVTGKSFSDIDAVGFYFFSSTNASGNQPLFASGAFTVSGLVVIPEPATIALALLGGILLFIVRRRVIPARK